MKDELASNPLVQESALPYSAPDFSKIKTEHFKPAIIEGIRVKKEIVNAIANSIEVPTFENTIIALEQSGNQLSKATSVFYALSSAHTNDTLQALEEEFAPLMAALEDEMYLNSKLFERIEALYDQKEDLKLDAEDLKLLEEYYTDFVIAGAKLEGKEKDQLKEINSQLATLTTQFGKKVLKAMKDGALVIDKNDVAQLDGLSDSYLNSIKTEDGNYKIPMNNYTQQDVLQLLNNREMRKKVFENAWMRADGTAFDTKDLVADIVNLRAKKAQLLGFDNYADWSLQKTMAGNSQNVRTFFDGLIPAAMDKAAKESKVIEDMMHSKGVQGNLEAWDWNYYAELVRKRDYDLNEEEIKPYFDMMSVLQNGVFYAANKLYGITFKERKDIPVYHEDVLVYELFEEDGTELGLFYVDYFERDSKSGGAWMGNFIEQSYLNKTKPVIYNVCNFPKPAKGEPALLSFDNVITMFHEFGHALHGFFASQKYESISGTNTARDFVEFPSQFNENWATYPEVFKNYAKHYQTGEPMPQELLDKIEASQTFNQGYSLSENITAANLDMAWHMIPASKIITKDDVSTFENEAILKVGLGKVNAVKVRYRSTYFAHIFSGGYGAGYYAYSWTEMLDHDAYGWFVENGGMTRANGQRLREMILSKGNTQSYEEMYERWRGKAPSPEFLLKARGLK
ncbi:MAG: M3 family metallopeptidase [Brumimicrobium sp.]|nr:M3 family metallopeptidase [Brumimicrobium sp.]